MLEKHSYTPYGEELKTNADLSKTTWLGKERDAESGLGDHGVRKYDWETGRFTGTDPLWEKYYGWNPWQYSANNPVMMVDVNGEAWETAWDVGNVIYDGIRGVYYEVKGNRQKANEAWTDLGYDLGAALIPFVPAGLSKLKYADEVADGLNKIDDVVDATKNSKVSQKTLDAAEAKAKQFDDVKTEKMGNPKGGKGNSKEKIPKQVARELGIDPKQLKDKIHDSKRTEKKKGKDNYEWDEVMEMGKDLPKKKK